MEAEQFYAASLEALREIRDLLASPPTTTSGGGGPVQIALNGHANGAAPKLPRGISYDPDGHPAYIAGHTLDDGRRKRVRVRIKDHGDDALRYASVVLDVLKGRDRERNLGLLPESLRMTVMLALLPA